MSLLTIPQRQMTTSSMTTLCLQKLDDLPKTGSAVFLLSNFHQIDEGLSNIPIRQSTDVSSNHLLAASPLTLRDLLRLYLVLS